MSGTSISQGRLAGYNWIMKFISGCMFSGPASSIPLSHHPPHTEFWDRAGLVITSRGPGSSRSRHEGFGYHVNSTSGYREVPIRGFLSHFDLHVFQFFLDDNHEIAFSIRAALLVSNTCFILAGLEVSKVLYCSSNRQLNNGKRPVTSQHRQRLYCWCLSLWRSNPRLRKHTIRERRPHRDWRHCRPDRDWHSKARSKRNVRRSIFYLLVLPGPKSTWVLLWSKLPVYFSW